MKSARVMIESVLQVPDAAEVEWTVAGEELDLLAEPRAGNTILQALSEEEFQARYSGNGTGQP
jgi:hypothetical protein